jgi:hypothetical protein
VRNKQRSFRALIFASLFACQASQEKAPVLVAKQPEPTTKAPTVPAVTTQWLARASIGPVASLSELCAAPDVCEDHLDAPLAVTAPFQEAGTLLRKSGEIESSMLALKLADQWFGVEVEALATKEKDLTSRLTYQFTSLQGKTIQQQPALFIQGIRREAVFCDNCANPIARTTPSTIYESEFFKLCVITPASQVVCTNTIDSAHDQDGPSKLSFELKDDGSIMLQSPAGLLSKEKRQSLEPGIYSVLLP